MITITDEMKQIMREKRRELINQPIDRIYGELLAAVAPLIEREVLERAAQEITEIAAIIDHPSMYMSGPSQQAKRAARVIADAIRSLNTEARETETKTDNTFLSLVNEGLAEAEKAMKKFPQPNYVISKIAEEAGEVVKAAIHCAEGRETPENVRGEMRQLIAMLYRLWVEGDQVHGLAAIRSLK